MGKIAFVFPGQGAQVPGMGLSAFENSAAAKAIFEKADAIRPGTSAQCFEGSVDELKITKNTQSCLYVTELALAAVLTEQGFKADRCAGFSLGELSALCYAGAIDFEIGLKLVMRRGELMQQDAEKADTFMAAVIRLPEEKLMEIIAGFDNVYAGCIFGIHQRTHCIDIIVQILEIIGIRIDLPGHITGFCIVNGLIGKEALIVKNRFVNYVRENIRSHEKTGIIINTKEV